MLNWVISWQHPVPGRVWDLPYHRSNFLGIISAAQRDNGVAKILLLPLPLRVMVSKRYISYRKGWLHKTCLEDGIEGYRFASPLYTWYGRINWCLSIELRWLILRFRHCSALLLGRELTLGSIKTLLELVVEIVNRFYPSKLNNPPRHPIYPNSQLPRR